MIIKMVNEFKFTVVHFARPNLQSVHAHGFITGQNTVENQDWATVPPRSPGLWAIWLSRAVVRWAFGLLGRCGLLGCGSAFSKTQQIYCRVWDQLN